MKKVLLPLLLIILISISGLSAQTTVKKLDQLIEKARKKWNVPGMAVAVVKDGNVFLSKGYGTLEQGKPEKANGKSLFAIASNTKGFLSSAIATLVEEGKLSWDDKVTDYLPHFEVYDPYVTSELTIKDLLSHRVGLGTFSGDAIWYKSELPASEIIKLVKHVPQEFSFRAGYGYSNLMFITAGEVVRAVTGKPWDDYVKERFLVPLGMNRTITSTNQLEQKGNFAIPHKTKLDKNTPIDWVNWDNMSAAGAIISSSDDMARWLIMQLNNGTHNGATLLSAQQQNILWSFHNNSILSVDYKEKNPGTHFSGYGLGFGLRDYYGRLMVRHGGGYDGMYSQVVMIPEEKIGVVILTNSMSGISSPLSYAIINQFIEEEKKDWIAESFRPQAVDQRIVDLKNAKLSGTEPSLKLNKYTGAYHADMYGEMTIKKEGNDLRLTFSHSPKLGAKLKHWHNDTWEIIWDETHAWFDFGLVTFTLNNKLEVTGMKMNVPNGDIFFDEYEIIKK
ncbi:MAG: serine hydrolase [Bacteroidota bacterium]